MDSIRVLIANSCNANCHYCFKPKAKADFLTLENFSKLAFFFNESKVSRIRLMGGEPLLHPKIVDFLNITRANFPNALIDLDTNGTLILKMKDDFWMIAAGVVACVGGLICCYILFAVGASLI